MVKYGNINIIFLFIDSFFYKKKLYKTPVFKSDACKVFSFPFFKFFLCIRIFPKFLGNLSFPKEAVNFFAGISPESLGLFS